ncbi:NAC domain-containing protein 53 isoform X2 [Gastrolobium bilobum]|nr:NAC domain-containing protein 53 isoform X2 [Gastrolobium bilobum]
MKKTLVYHSGRAPRGARSNWVMHEYKLVDQELIQAGVAQDAFVLCRIFEKSGAGPKNGEKYGAPLIEEEWENDDVPAGDDEFFNEVSAGDTGAFVETDDLEQKLDIDATLGGADFTSNFYHGECSSYPEHSQEFISDQKPLAGTVEISEPQNDQPFNMAEQYGVDANLAKDGDNVELSHNENPLNFNYAVDDLDPYFNTIDNGLFLETNDLGNPGEGNLNEEDPYGIGMLDEYLTYPDDDICKYISFDSPPSLESENPISDQGPPFIQQNVEGETNNISMASKHDFEAQSNDEASLKKNQQGSNSVSGNTNPFVKQAHKLLASIPAPPAFASEFPTKEIALRLHPAAQSSNSAHVTTGMMSITDITFRGNAMDWMVGKNGGFNAIISTEFSQPDVNSAGLMPVFGLVSGKTAFVLSHGWIFLMFFSVMILSLSLKIGCFMYTGK